MGRANAEAHPAGQSQRILLRPRSRKRKTLAGEAVCAEADLGQRDWQGWAACGESGIGADRTRSARLSGRRRRNELVFVRVPSGDPVVLCPGFGEVQPVYEAAWQVDPRPVLL